MSIAYLHGVLACTALLAILGVPATGHAHGDIHARIEQLDKMIATHPTDYTLYLKRGDLYRQHREWPQALADFEQARRLDPRPVDLDLALGRTWLEAGQPEKALPFLERYLGAYPDHPQALLERGRARAALGERLAAANDYARAIDRLPQPTPDLYIEMASVLIAAGDGHLDASMEVIKKGTAKLGPLVSLVQYAVEMETAHGRYDDALAWIGTLPESLASQPPWLARRGDIQAAAGRTEAARASYQAAQEALTPILQRRSTAANLALEAELEKKIAGLGRPTPVPPRQ